jgi:thiol-disulfide isomerase/thioredoxin
VKHTGVFVCSTKWKEKEASRLEGLRKIESQPVRLEMASAEVLKRLRSNPTGQTLLVSFWATWCGTCIHEFSQVENTYRMYSVRDLELVTVSANMPDEKSSVQRLLEKMHGQQPQSPVRLRRHVRVAGGIRPQVGVGRALHGADRAGWQGFVSEVAYDRHSRIAADHPGESTV